MVLWARCEAGEPFIDLLDRVSSDLANDLAHDVVPFPRLVERSNPPRDRSRHPLFQVAFHVLTDTSDDQMALAGLAVIDRSP